MPGSICGPLHDAQGDFHYAERRDDGEADASQLRGGKPADDQRNGAECKTDRGQTAAHRRQHPGRRRQIAGGHDDVAHPPAAIHPRRGGDEGDGQGVESDANAQAQHAATLPARAAP